MFNKGDRVIVIKDPSCEGDMTQEYIGYTGTIVYVARNNLPPDKKGLYMVELDIKTHIKYVDRDTLNCLVSELELYKGLCIDIETIIDNLTKLEKNLNGS